MTKALFKYLLEYIRYDSVSCSMDTLSAYIAIIKIMMRYYPCNEDLKNVKTELVNHINDRLEEMFYGECRYYD